MSTSKNLFIFRPVWTFFAVLGVITTIVLGAAEVGQFIAKENLAWIPWVVIALLFVVLLGLVSHLAAVKAHLATCETSTTNLKNELKEAKAAREATEASVHAAGGLSAPDRKVAELLLEFASDKETLLTLENFPVQMIPGTMVTSMRELDMLRGTQAPFDHNLEQQFKTLSEGATLWLEKFWPISSIEAHQPDYYTVKRDRYLPEEAHAQHEDQTEELVDASTELHQKLLDYRRYYASL